LIQKSTFKIEELVGQYEREKAPLL
jgi:hypothetical protein